MQKITPFLWFDGQAEEAARLYTSAFRNSKLGKITRYGEAAMVKKLAAAGFSARRAPANIGHNSARMTFLARPA